jgi:hypothetical protein
MRFGEKRYLICLIFGLMIKFQNMISDARKWARVVLHSINVITKICKADGI